MKCWREEDAPVLRNQTLAARETTDLLLIDPTKLLMPAAHDRDVLETIGYALVRAGAELLEIDSRELGVLVFPVGDKGSRTGIVIYDSAPGGSGHVRELMDHGGDWLHRAAEVLWVSDDHDKRCATACLDCILSFDSQHHATQFKRRAAHALLISMLGGGSRGEVNAGVTTGYSTVGSTSGSNPTSPPRTKGDRLREAAKRLSERRPPG